MGILNRANRHTDPKERTIQIAISILLLGVSVRAASDVQLIEAIKDQNRNTVLALIEARSGINTALPDGSTPLAWAVYQDDAEVVTLLLRAGAKVNAADEYGETPLTLACANGNAAVVEKLLGAGADAKAARSKGETALLIAADSGNSQIVKLLIEHGATIEAVEDVKGQNALMWAAAKGNAAVVDVLLNARAKPNATSKRGFTALLFAAEKGDAQSISALLAAGADINYTVPGGSSPLVTAITAKQSKAAEVLIAKGADVRLKNSAGETALHIASEAGDLSMIQHLISKGADVNARTNPIKDERGAGIPVLDPAGEQTPLLLATAENHLDVMHALANAGADPLVKAQGGVTLMMAAAFTGHVETAEYAYSLNPDLKSVTDTKSTVMHAAAANPLEHATEPEVCEVLQFLAGKGADLDAVDSRGRTPIAIAADLPIDKAVELLTKLIRATGATPRVPANR